MFLHDKTNDINSRNLQGNPLRSLDYNEHTTFMEDTSRDEPIS